MKTNYSNVSMLDMIFEHRNQQYGAYVLRRDSNETVIKAGVATFSTVLLLLLINFVSEHLKASPIKHDVVVVTTTTDLLTEVKKKIIEPKPPVAENTAKLKATIENPEKRVVATSQTAADTIATNDDLKDLESGLTTNTNGATDGSGVTDSKGNGESLDITPPAAPVATNVVRDWSEVMPSFPGGDRKLQQFLVEHTVYPDRERQLELNGKAYVQFIVNEDGSISNIKVIKSDTQGFGKAAMNAVASLPKFIPGMQSGVPVKVRMSVPLSFKLTE